MVSPALTSSKRGDWQTPEWFLELVRKVAPIALDPATVPSNPTGAEAILTRGKDLCGLSGDWVVMSRGGLTFVNPEYGKALGGEVPFPTANTGWAAKMARKDVHGLYLVPSRTETAWFRRLHTWCDWRLDWSSPEYGSRIHFIDPVTKRKITGTPFPSTVFYRGPLGVRFIETFRDHGTLIRAEAW